MADACGPCLGEQEQAVPQARQNPAHPGFVGPSVAYDCAQCVRFYANRLQFPPDLDADGYAAWTFYQRVSGQQRSGGMDVIGLDWTAVEVAFRLYQIPVEERRPLFERLLIIDRLQLERRQQKQKDARDTDEALRKAQAKLG